MVLSAPIDRREGRQARWFRWMVLLSLVFHAAIFTLGSSALLARIPAVPDPVVFVELMESPPPESPAPPPVLENAPPPGAAVRTARAETAARRPSLPSSARRWLEKLDDPLAEKPRVQQRERGTPSALPARRLSGDSSTRPDDVAAASRRRRSDGGRWLDALEGRIRARRSPIVLGGEGIDGGPVVNGLTDDVGDPIPAGVRDMIRNRVAGYLPELEAAYSSAFRVNPGLMGKLVIRIRIDARGNVARVEPIETPALDGSFAAAVLEKVRGWVFLPPAGIAVEVIYPFVFVAPS